MAIISDTIQEFNGVRYYRCGNYFQNNGKRLHVAIWESCNGTVPKGYHVHHKDGDRSNNDIANLQLMISNMHLSLHARAPERAEYNQRHIKDIRELAAEWHRSPEGIAWHSQHAKEMWQNKPPKEYTCTECGEGFITYNTYGDGNIFCSNKCKSAHRRSLAVDNEARECVYCKRRFVTNKYSKAKCCSRECAVKNRWNK